MQRRCVQREQRRFARYVTHAVRRFQSRRTVYTVFFYTKLEKIHNASRNATTTLLF